MLYNGLGKTNKNFGDTAFGHTGAPAGDADISQDAVVLPMLSTIDPLAVVTVSWALAEDINFLMVVNRFSGSEKKALSASPASFHADLAWIARTVKWAKCVRGQGSLAAVKHDCRFQLTLLCRSGLARISRAFSRALNSSTNQPTQRSVLMGVPSSSTG